MSDSEPLPRDLDAIKAWYRASQVQDDPYRPVLDLPPIVVHQIQMSLTEDLALCRGHLKRLIEYAGRE